jgi:hypothetical protein
MKDYFTKVKALFEKAKAFGKPVVIILEGDSFGFMEMQSGDDASHHAAIAETGLPELAGLPNTVAGFGLAYLQLRRAVGADNVIMGPDVPAYASGADILYDASAPLQAHVDQQYKFLAQMGLAANQTGDTFDIVASCPLSADSDWYRLVNNDPNRWWDASDNAPTSTLSMNRYAEWLSLFNQASGKRWVLWQVPMGNSNHLNIANDDSTPRYGYKDNRPEYFLNTDAPSATATRDAHLGKFADAGVFAIVFGRGGEQGVSTYLNDTWTDGQLFIKSRAGALLNSGGFAIDTGNSQMGNGGVDAGTSNNNGGPDMTTNAGNNNNGNGNNNNGNGNHPNGNPADGASHGGCALAGSHAPAPLSLVALLVALALARRFRRA